MFAIEHLPADGGFWMFQSYAQAYSLRSWLACSLLPEASFEEGQLMLNEELKGIVDTALRVVTLGRNSVDNIYDPPLSSILDPIFLYIEYVALYDQQQVVDNCRAATDTDLS